MSTSTVQVLTLISQQITIYVGLFIVTVGFIGNILNIIVFLSLKTFRENSCSFYLIIMSIVNTFHLFTGLFTYIMINGFSINWTNLSLFYCKFRQFYVQFCSIMSFTCMCLATLDQFFATCSHPRWHKLNNFKLARYIIIGISILWISHGIPYVIYFNHNLSTITNQINCIITDIFFQKYYTIIYSCGFIGFFPIIIMFIFGILSYRNVRQIAYRTIPLVRRELDKQLTIMVLTQVFYDIIVVTPFIIQSIVSVIIGTPTNLDMLLKLNFIKTLTNILYYFRFSGSFYIYIIVSKRFRQQLIYVLFQIHLDRWHRQRFIKNQIVPQIQNT